jgi:UDP-glucose 4-epimerase
LGVRHGLRRFVYASTGGAVYGEPEFMPVTEEHPINPDCPYGISKHTVEHYLRVYQLIHGLRYTVLRYPNVFGPRQDPHGEAGVVAIFIETLSSGRQCTIYGDGSKTRDYVYVEDIVAGNLLGQERGEGDVFNLGRGVEISDFAIFDAVRRGLGLNGAEPRYDRVRPGEINHICLDAAKIRDRLGWTPSVSLDEGIARTVDWYRRTRGRG